MSKFLLTVGTILTIGGGYFSFKYGTELYYIRKMEVFENEVEDFDKRRMKNETKMK